MPSIYRRCAGLDVHKEFVEVCVLGPVGQSDPPVRQRFGVEARPRPFADVAGFGCRRIAEFLHGGRLDGSFVPPPEIFALRALTRLRLSWLEQRNEVHNQIRDLLETVNIKLSSVATDIMGVKGRNSLRAILGGMDSPERLSWKARGSLRKKEAQLREALKGDFTGEFCWLLARHLQNYDWLTQQIEELEKRLAEKMEPYFRRPGTVPGGRIGAGAE